MTAGKKTLLFCAGIAMTIAFFYGCVARLFHAPVWLVAGVVIVTVVVGILGLPLVIRRKE